MRHLASCERCRDQVAGLAALPALLRRLPAETAAQLIGGSTSTWDPGPLRALQHELIRRLARRRCRHRWLTATAVAVLAAAAGAGWASRLSSLPGPGQAVPGTVLDTTRIGRVAVLTNGRRFTLYWFAPDTPVASKCTGSCAWRWPPVTGPATPGPGGTGHLGIVTRPDGKVQATYDGHRLYSASVDTTPGQARGNDLDAFGGVWHEVLVPGPAPAPASPSPVASTSGGYVY